MRLIACGSLAEEDLDAWSRLAARAIEPNPFHEALFVPAAARALGQADVQILVAEADGDWIGALPVVVRRRPALPAFAEAWQHPYCFLGTPLVAADRLSEFAAALADSLAKGEHFRLLMLRRCSTGPVLDTIAAACEGRRGTALLFERRFERGAYRGRPESDQPLAWLRGKRRSELKRQRRKLSEELGAEVEIEERPDTEAAIADFLALESSGWKGEQETALASDRGSLELFRQMCESFGPAGRLRIRALAGDGRALAMTCDLAAGDTLFGFKSAYDESLRSFSPGVQLQADAFQAFDRECAAELFDSCSEPDNEMVNGLWPDRRGIATVIFGPDGIRGAIARRLLDRAYSRRDRAD